jgi:hypothetical protein
MATRQSWMRKDRNTVQGFRPAFFPEVDSIISSNMSHAPPERLQRLRA